MPAEGEIITYLLGENRSGAQDTVLVLRELTVLVTDEDKSH